MSGDQKGFAACGGAGSAGLLRGDGHIRDGPVLAGGEELVQDSVIQGMPGLNAIIGAQNWTAGKVEIADRIEKLVPDKFVGKTQAAGVHNLIIAQNDRVIHGAAQGQPLCAEIINLVQETEGPGLCDVMAEITVEQACAEGLTADFGMVEFDFAAVDAHGRGFEAYTLAVLFKAHFPEDANRAARCGQRFNADGINRFHEGHRAAVHYGHFGAVYFDGDVIDSATAEGGHQMFDGSYGRAVRVADDRAQAGVDDMIPTGRNNAIILYIRADKDNSCVRFRRSQGHVRVATGMKTDPVNRYRFADRFLSVSRHRVRNVFVKFP